LYVRNRGEQRLEAGRSSRGLLAVCPVVHECRSLSANEVSTRRVAAVSGIFKIPRPLHQVCPFSGALSLLAAAKKDSSPAVGGCGDGDQWSSGIWRDARPRGWGLVSCPRLAASCHHTADVSCSNRLPVCRADEGKKEGCRVTGRKHDRQTERRRSANGAFMHGREHLGVYHPSLPSASTSGRQRVRNALQGCR
jgi:hypothetical protein